MTQSSLAPESAPASPPAIDSLLARYAYRRGVFTLSSGATADEYLDVKSALLHPDAGVEIACLVADAIGGVCMAVAGVETGGALLALLVANRRRKPCLCVRKAPREHGATQGGIEGLANLAPGELFSTVWLVEDVITSGASVHAAMQTIADHPRLSLSGIVTVVDREKGGMAAISAECPGIPIIALTTLAAVRLAATHPTREAP